LGAARAVVLAPGMLPSFCLCAGWTASLPTINSLASPSPCLQHAASQAIFWPIGAPDAWRGKTTSESTLGPMP